MKHLIIISALLVIALNATSKDDLARCWARQVQPLQGRYLKLTYTDNDHRITHSFEPWQTTLFRSSGTIWCNATALLKSDTLILGSIYHSKTQLSSTSLLYLDYGDEKLSDVTTDMFLSEPVSEAHYSPAILINYFYTHPQDVTLQKTPRYAIYTTTINKVIVKLFIRKKDDLLVKVSTLGNNDLYGDVASTINYTAFSDIGPLPHPTVIHIDNVNNKVYDTIILKSISYVNNVIPLLTTPSEYEMKEKTPKKPEITVEKYSDHIHFINLLHTSGRSMVVEFDSFLVVTEAPLSSENGELIINEAHKIAPNKPIKYFLFTHYHPDYTGGIRPFIRNGATVLCTNSDVPYIQYVATAPHTLLPDSLQLQARTLKTDTIGTHKIITDGKYTMNIYLLGAKSVHTNDYLMYYFPTEKMLFEGDLVYIPVTGTIRRAGKRQAGLYNAIKELNLNAETIVQSWPVGSTSIKSIIPFTDMEAAMQAK